jgi:mycothiol synthase
MTTTETTRWLDIPGAPSIPGVRARRFRGSSDWPLLSELTTASNTFDGVPWMPTADNLRLEVGEADGTDPFEDFVIVELDDRVIAASGIQRVVRDGVPTYDAWGNVHPSVRRRGIGTWLMGRNIQRIRERADREDRGTQVMLAGFAEETEAGHRALLADFGFTTVRQFFLMRRDLHEAIPEAALPEGLEVRTVTTDQHRRIADAEEEAFRDHWGHRAKTESDFHATFDRAELDTDLWVVAWDGDEIAGVVQNWIWPEENAGLGVKRGWLEHISVRRPWRRRGLARAITAASLTKLREAGLDEGMLGVDSENANGALGLYEGLGFVVHSRAAAYRRRLDRAAGEVAS